MFVTMTMLSTIDLTLVELIFFYLNKCILFQVHLLTEQLSAVGRVKVCTSKSMNCCHKKRKRHELYMYIFALYKTLDLNKNGKCDDCVIILQPVFTAEAYFRERMVNKDALLRRISAHIDFPVIINPD